MWTYFIIPNLKIILSWDAGVVQSVKHPTLDLILSLDPRVVSSSPVLGSTLGVQPTSKQNKITFFNITTNLVRKVC